MIQSFRCAHTQALFEGRTAARFANIRSMAERKLAMQHRATRLEDLRVPPNNRLEKLSGDRAGQWSIRVNYQWRVCFEWRDDQAHGVEIVDYH